MTPTKAILVSQLTKQFGDFKAVDAISFDITQGEIFGFLGPNGAGKSTTIKMLTTILRPTSGSAQVFNLDVEKQPLEVRKTFGIVFQEYSLDMDLTGWENLRFHARMYGMKEDSFKERAKMLMELVELTDWENKIVKTYSGGMRRRLELIRSVIHKPKLLFLDEPTLGLDPQSRRHIWTYLRKLNKEEGITIFLTTHYMEEADQLCDRVAIIDHGKIVANDTPQSLKTILGGDVLTIDAGMAAPELLQSIKEGGKLGAQIKKVDVVQGKVRIMGDRGESLIPSIVNLATARGIDIKNVSMNRPSLDDVFFHYTGNQIRVEGPEMMPGMRMQMMKKMRQGSM